MSRSAVNKLALAALCVGVGTVAYGQMPAGVSALRVNPSTVAAAERPEAEYFAAALALERVPAGFVFAADERRPVATPRTKGHDTSTVAVTHALDRFLSAHPNYRAGQSAWGLVIQPRTQTVCDAALGLPLADAGISEPAYVAFWELARMVNPAETPAAPPAVVCGGGDCHSGAASAHRARVTVTLGGTPLQEVLSQMVAQAPGLVWTLRERRRGRDEPPDTSDTICQFGYFDNDQYIQTSYVFGKGRAGARH